MDITRILSQLRQMSKEVIRTCFILYMFHKLCKKFAPPWKIHQDTDSRWYHINRVNLTCKNTPGVESESTPPSPANPTVSSTASAAGLVCTGYMERVFESKESIPYKARTESIAGSYSYLACGNDDLNPRLQSFLKGIRCLLCDHTFAIEECPCKA